MTASELPAAQEPNQNPWRNRIVDHGEEAPDQLLANPLNFRVHPTSQQEDVARLLDTVGWLRDVIVNRRSGNLIDGHLRVDLALRRGEPAIPVSYVDLDEDEERLALAALDATIAGAVIDEAKFGELTSMVETEAFDDLFAKTRKLAKNLDGKAKASGKDEEIDRFPIFDRDTILENAFEHFRALGKYPLKQLALHEQMQELNLLATTRSESLPRSTRGYAVASMYHPHRFAVEHEGGKTPLEVYEDDKGLRRAIKFKLDSGAYVGADSLAGLEFADGAQMASNFRPGFALWLYREFTDAESVVLDTSAGFGGRLVGFLASSAKKYIGIDPSTKTHEGNRRLVETLGFEERVELINRPAEEISPEEIGTVDFCFTSPPYFSKEHYADEETQAWKRYATGAEWREGFLRKMIALQWACLRPGGFAVVNIADVMIKRRVFPLVDWTRMEAEAIGFVLREMREYGVARVPGNTRAEREEMPFEPVLFFQKPEDAAG